MNERNRRSQLVPFNYFVSMEHQMEELSVRETDKIKLKLIPAQTSEERKRNIIANVVVVEDESNGSGLVPYIDETITATNASQLHGAQGKHDKPRLRYYAVGPSTYRIKCPLCRQQGDAAVMRTAGLKDITCCLSMLSCIFPVFWFCCICNWFGCNREWTTKGLYCSQCGGKLGIQNRPKK